jgi:hypothetical protein
VRVSPSESNWRPTLVIFAVAEEEENFRSSLLKQDKRGLDSAKPLRYFNMLSLDFYNSASLSDLAYVPQ